MIKFKIGDIVRVTPYLERGVHYDIHPDMLEHAGRKAVIVGYEYLGGILHYKLDFDAGRWYWYDDALLPEKSNRVLREGDYIPVSKKEFEKRIKEN